MGAKKWTLELLKVSRPHSAGSQYIDDSLLARIKREKQEREKEEARLAAEAQDDQPPPLEDSSKN